MSDSTAVSTTITSNISLSIIIFFFMCFLIFMSVEGWQECHNQ